MQRVYGLSIEHNVFTPSSIRHDEILYGDHPFSAFLLLKSYVRSYDSKSGSVVSSSISLGFIGPAAFGKEMQTSIHTWLENLLPLGWDHQIRNDFLLNYQLNYERMIIKVPENFTLQELGLLMQVHCVMMLQPVCKLNQESSMKLLIKNPLYFCLEKVL
ncbi:MAG: DUF2219 family protein [Bacteroidetes bacterium]|nr:DUF2219 family protein [Bacteroidota bacterium]